jgi:hypothetical protein
MEPHGCAARGAGAAVGPAGLRRTQTQAVHSDVLDEYALLPPVGQRRLTGAATAVLPFFGPSRFLVLVVGPVDSVE